jgi:hypothetical protein
VKTTPMSLLAIAVLLGACGGAGSGGGAAPRTSGPPASAPAVAGTEAPKQYDSGKTKDPSASPDDYYGY